jgi:hypothetical protein
VSEMVAIEKKLKKLVLELVKLKERMAVLDCLEDSKLYIESRDRLEMTVDEIAQVVLVGEGAE